jgi:hypothetical protein
MFSPPVVVPLLGVLGVVPVAVKTEIRLLAN